MTVLGFKKNYQPIADAIARLDIAQVDREAVAEAVADGLEAAPGYSGKGNPKTHWARDLFVLLASDPLVSCCGYDRHDTGEHVDCPESVEIRIGMHLSSAPDGRSAAWEPRRPEAHRCVSCGAMQFIPGYQESVLAREQEAAS